MSAKGVQFLQLAFQGDGSPPCHPSLTPLHATCLEDRRYRFKQTSHLTATRIKIEPQLLRDWLLVQLTTKYRNKEKQLDQYENDLFARFLPGFTQKVVSVGLTISVHRSFSPTYTNERRDKFYDRQVRFHHPPNSVMPWRVARLRVASELER